MQGQAIVTIKDRQWSCSVASTPTELVTGLSGVPSMPPETGMLFVLGYEQIVTVTAEDMLFPLSVIFIGENLRVTEVALLLEPGGWGTTNLPCRYFMEVNVGEADGIEAGDQVDIAFSTPTTSWIAPVVTFASVVMAGAMMAKMGKTMAEAVFGKPKERPVLYGPRGERLSPQTRAGRKGYAIAARRLVYDPELKRKKTEYVRQSKIYDDEWTAKVFLKSWIKKHPHEEFKVIEVSSETQAQNLPQTGLGRHPSSEEEATFPVEARKDPTFCKFRYSEKLKIEPVASEIVTPDKSVAVIPTEPRRPRPRRKDELEFLPDSPEFLAYTIDDIGYREKLDTAFLNAIARAKGG